MALSKLFQRIFFHNNTTPALNEDNLNAMSKGLSDVDDRLIELAGTIMEDVPEIQHDLEILEPAIENIDANVTRAETAADNAEEEALKSEGYAVGTQDGVEVTSGEYYQNNAKYYAEIANPPIENTVDFTDVITITDAINKAAKDVRLKVEAVQDLHGYNNPWVGGSGKNLLGPDVSYSSNPYIVNGITFTLSSDGTLSISTGSGGATANTWYEYNKGFILKAGSYVFSAKAVNGVSPYLNNAFTGTEVYGTESGTAFTVSAQATGKMMIRINSGTVLTTALIIKPMVSVGGGAWEPYTNICPISGWDNAKVTRGGKNRATFTADYIKTNNGGASSWNGNVKTVGNMTFTMLVDSDNKVVGVNFNGSHTQLVQFKMGTFTKVSSIKIHGCPSGGSSSTYGLQIYDETASSWGATDYGNGIAVNNLDPSHIYSLNVYVRANISINNLVFRAMASVEGGGFEPYQDEEITISLNGTRYGGTLDVTSGVLTLDKGYIEYDGSEDEVWRAESGSGYVEFYVLRNSLKKSLSYDGMIICNRLNTYSQQVALRNNYGISGYSDTSAYPNNNWLYVSIPSITTVNDFITWLASNPLQVVYELATPQTIQLTAEEVYLLYGYNTLFGDCGDISLTYDASGIIHIEEAKLDTETLKTIAAASSDFADFKARIAAL